MTAKDSTSRSPILGKPIRAVNVGLDLFAETLEKEGLPVVRVDYRPPAGGDEKLVRILEALR